MSNARFNEETLYEDICGVWGAHGAHAHICRWLITEVDKLNAKIFELQRQLDKAQQVQ